jgi:hypothetical protein
MAEGLNNAHMFKAGGPPGSLPMTYCFWNWGEFVG